MFLTRAEEQKVKEEAERLGIEGDAEVIVRQAFEAIFQGQADEAAYSVTEAAGAIWLSFDMFYKEKAEVNGELARAILTQGKKDGTHEGPIPEDDGQAVKLAQELVEMAETAWNQHVRGPEVEVLIRMAREGGNGGPPEEQEKPPEPPPQEPKAEEPAPEPEQPSEEPKDGNDADDLSQIEPWDGYDGERVSDIITGIDAGAAEYEQSEFVELLSNVWAYEAAHKKRQTVLDHLEKIAARLQGKTDAPAEGSEQPSDATPDEAPVDEGPQGEGDPEDSAAAEREPDQVPQPEPSEEVGVEGEGESPEAEAPVEEPAPKAKPKPAAKRGRRKKSEGEDDQKQEEGQREPDDADSDYEDLLKRVEADLESERVHKPSAPEEKIPDLPWDWTKMTDSELQSFYSTYSSLAYYKGYQVIREERRAIHCKAAADELHNALLVNLDKYDHKDKEKKVALIEAEVENDENIKMWRRRQRKHETFAAAHRNERDSVGKIVEALSRMETMRQNEYERSGRLDRRRRD